MKTTARCLLAGFMLLSPTILHAKRMSPAPVPPVVYEGLRFEAPAHVIVDGQHRSGGYVEVFDEKTNRLLYVIKVYEVKSDKELERDVQDVFITCLSVHDKQLVVLQELGLAYLVDLKTFEVSQALDAQHPASKSCREVRK